MQQWVLATLLAILVFIVFENTLSNGFVFDDVSMIQHNPAIRSLSHARLYFTRPFFSVGQAMTGPVQYDYYRPMVFMSYLADYLAWGLVPWGYHLSNIFLHAAATVLVFLLLVRLRLKATVSFIAAALFGVHPALADSVAGVSGRSDPLCAVFFLTSVYCYVGARQRAPRGAKPMLLCACAAFVLALLSKENAIAIPIVLTAYEIIRPDGSAGETARLRVKPLVPIYSIALVYFLWRSHVVPSPTPLPVEGVELARRLMTAAQAAASYLGLMFLPSNLGFETFIPMLDTVATPQVVVAEGALLLLLGGALLSFRSSPRVSFFLLWFFACLLPFSYFFLFHPGPSFFTPPHFLYFPSIGLAALWALAIVNLAQSNVWRSGGWQWRALLAWPAITIMFFSVQTIRRNTEWRDDLTFFSAMVRYAPKSIRVHIGLANTLLNAGQTAGALAEYATAYELTRSRPDESAAPEPNAPQGAEGEVKGRLVIANYYAAAALSGMGDAHQMMGETGEAVRSYKMALRENAFDSTIYLKLAHAYERAGRFDDAIVSYERAVKLDKNQAEAAFSLQVALTKKEVYDQAKRVYLTAHLSRQQGSADGLYGEAVMLRLSGKQEAAAALLREALKKKPSHFGANMALGQILSEQGEHEEAFASFSAAFASRPTSALAAYELALTSVALGDTLAAELWASKAYELEPDRFYENFLDDIKKRSEEGQAEK